MQANINGETIEIRADLVVALDDLFNALDRHEGDMQTASVEALALDYLTEYEYVIFSEGYDKNGDVVIWEDQPSWSHLREEANAARCVRGE